MLFKNFEEVFSALIEVVQAGTLPVLGVCFVVSLLFFIGQVVFSFQDFSFQFLTRLFLVVIVIVFMAKSVGEKYIEFTKKVFMSAPTLLR